MDQYLNLVLEHGVSDFCLSADCLPRFRVDGGSQGDVGLFGKIGKQVE